MKRIVLTDEKVWDVEARLQISPRNSVRRLAQEHALTASIAMDKLQKVSHNLFMRSRHVCKQKGVHFSTCYKAR
jgi:hypothetical protein